MLPMLLFQLIATGGDFHSASASYAAILQNQPNNNALALAGCIEFGLAAEAAGSIAEAFSIMQDCLRHRPAATEGNVSVAISSLRSFAVLQNELARQATVLLACKEAIGFYDGALESMRSVLPLEQDSGIEKEIQGLEFRTLCMKPALYLIQVFYN